MNFRRRQIAFLIFAYFFIKLLAKQRRWKVREGKSPFSGEFFLSLLEKQKIPDRDSDWPGRSGKRNLPCLPDDGCFPGYGFAES